MLPLFRCFSNDQNGTLRHPLLFFSCFLVSGRRARPCLFFFFSAVNGFHIASSAGCREVIRQHSITGGQSVCVCSPTSQQLWAGFEFSVSSGRGGFPWRGYALNYHHLARLPSCNHVFEQRRNWCHVGRFNRLMFLFFLFGLENVFHSLLYLIECKDTPLSEKV